MSADSKIEWTDHTFNPWWGCTRISAGCAHCYADTYSTFRGHKVWGDDAGRRFFSDAHWNEPLKWNRAAEESGKIARVFCGSMCDVMVDRPDVEPHRQRLWKLIEQTPWLTWLLLTKRPENYKKFIPRRWPGSAENMMFGCTTENQENFDARMPHMQRMHMEGFRTFLSMEPLLGPISIEHWQGNIDWAIVGGESGPGARPMHPDWARSLRDECQAAGVPFFFKQWGEWTPWEPRFPATVKYMKSDGTLHDQPGSAGVSNSPMVRVGKKSAGRLLDGREWNELPELPAPAEVVR